MRCSACFLHHIRSRLQDRYTLSAAAGIMRFTEMITMAAVNYLIVVFRTLHVFINAKWVSRAILSPIYEGKDGISVFNHAKSTISSRIVRRVLLYWLRQRAIFEQHESVLYDVFRKWSAMAQDMAYQIQVIFATAYRYAWFVHLVKRQVQQLFFGMVSPDPLQTYIVAFIYRIPTHGNFFPRFLLICS